MKCLFLYRRWNFIMFFNNVINYGYFTYFKKFVILRFDTNQFNFWIYKKKKKFENLKIVNLKKRFKFL